MKEVALVLLAACLYFSGEASAQANGSAGGNTTCAVAANTIYDGENIANYTATSATQCGQNCILEPGCNVFTYCGSANNCRASGNLTVANQVCVLKNQTIGSSGKPTGPNGSPIDLSSGFCTVSAAPPPPPPTLPPPPPPTPIVTPPQTQPPPPPGAPPPGPISVIPAVGPPLSPPPSPTPSPPPSSGLSGGALGGIAAGAVVGVGVVAFLVFFLVRRRRGKKAADSDEESSPKAVHAGGDFPPTVAAYNGGGAGGGWQPGFKKEPEVKEDESISVAHLPALPEESKENRDSNRDLSPIKLPPAVSSTSTVTSHHPIPLSQSSAASSRHGPSQFTSTRQTSPVASASQASPLASPRQSVQSTSSRHTLLPDSLTTSRATSESHLPVPRSWALPPAHLRSVDTTVVAQTGSAGSVKILGAPSSRALHSRTSSSRQALSIGSGTSKRSGDTGSPGLGSPPLPWSNDWQIKADEIVISKDPSGAPLKLGSGAYGSVFKATIDGVIEVAVKMFHEVHSPKEQEDMLREVAILKGCRDRHIVNFLGACIMDGRLLLVTEYMEAGDLWHALQLHHRDALSWYKKGKDIAVQVARGLHYLHRNKIIHFDLKSANILLTRGGDAKISDVGFASILTNSHISNAGGYTFAWAAPEVLMGAGCTEKVDIYSYGVLLWEIVTGEQPKRGMLRETRNPEECPGEVESLIHYCLAFRPEDRPNCREIVEVLSTVV